MYRMLVIAILGLLSINGCGLFVPEVGHLGEECFSNGKCRGDLVCQLGTCRERIVTDGDTDGDPDVNPADGDDDSVIDGDGPDIEFIDGDAPDVEVPDGDTGEEEPVICTPHDNVACYAGDVYWYDSCGNREDMQTECDNCLCDNNACLPDDEYVIDCYENDLYWYDCHGERKAVKQHCDDGTTCDALQNFCVPDATCYNDEDCGEDQCDEDFGPCVNTGDICAKTNQEECRTCIDIVCTDGSCVPDAQYESCQPCARDTDYDPCGDDYCHNWRPCEYDDACDSTGDQFRGCYHDICDEGVCAQDRFYGENKNNVTSCNRSTGANSCITNMDLAGYCDGTMTCVADGSLPAEWTDPNTEYTWRVHPTMLEEDPRMTQTEAVQYCDDLGGWRLPTITELRSLIRGCVATTCGDSDESCGGCGLTDSCTTNGDCTSPLCDGYELGNGPDHGCYWPAELEGECGSYWSTKSLDNGGTQFLYVDFQDAAVSNIYKTSALHARCIKTTK